MIEDVVVILDREQGGHENLKKLGIRVHSLLKLNELFEVLIEENHLSNDKSIEILNWIHDTKVGLQDNLIASYLNLGQNKKDKPKLLSYKERAKLTENQIAKRLFELIEEKQSNLCVAIDEHSKDKILKIAKQVAPNVVVIKLHCDIIDDFDQDFVNKLKSLAKEYQFLIFEDRKFADIGNTVSDQFAHGLYKIAKWADLINCHVITGEGIIESLKSSANLSRTGCLIVAELSSKGNLITSSYTDVAVKFAENHSDFVIGFISQNKLTSDQKFIHFTPGINLDDSNDKFDGESHTTPNQAIKDKGTDIIIVEHAITRSNDPSKLSKIYQQEAYNAYKELLS